MTNERDALRPAFLEATYGTREERFVLGEAPDGTLSWAPPGVRWAVVTGWNAGARRQSAKSNALRDAHLRRVLTGSVGTVRRGWNGEGDWEEASWIVVGAGLRETLAWGSRFEQAAVLWSVGRRAALVWCGAPPGARAVRVERYWVRRVGHED